MTSTNGYTAPAWGGDGTFDFDTSSGAHVKLRMLGMDDIVELGLVDELDTLGSTVENEHIKRVRGKQPQDHKRKATAKQDEDEQIRAVLRNKDGFRRMSLSIEKIVVRAVIEPGPIARPVLVDDDGNIVLDESHNEIPLPLGDDRRKNGTIYTDTIPYEDKVDIFNASFKGVGKLANFREESSEDVGGVEVQ